MSRVFSQERIMKSTRIVLAIMFAAFMFCGQAQAWDHHFYFTRIVTTSLEKQLQVLQAKTKQSNLETFIRKNEKAIKTVFRDFYFWKLTTYNYKQLLLSAENHNYLFGDGAGKLTSKRFLELLGIKETGLGSSKISQEFANQFGFSAINQNTVLPFSTWLAMFSDEPDWGADIGLFGNGDPRYGAIPFGDVDSLSSQGPFHMYFANENIITYKARASLKESMAMLRFDIFTRLAGLAWQNRDLFWTARFLANSLHYLQDVSNPYHSSALPYATVFMYVKYFTVKDKDKFVSDNTKILSNRHFAYEAAGLEFIRLTRNSLDHFIQVDNAVTNGRELALNPDNIKNTDFLHKIFNRVSKAAYKISRPLDKLISKTFPKNLITDPNLSPKDGDDFQLDTWFNEALLDSVLKGEKSDRNELVKVFIKDATRTIECSALLISYILR